MAPKGKGKQIAGKAPAGGLAGSSATKRKAEELGNPNSSGSKRKKRPPGVLQFFDDAAVEADPDYEDEEDLEMEKEHEHPDDGTLVDNLGRVEKSHRFPFFVKEEELSGDELEELIKDRYCHSSEYVVHNDDSVEYDEMVSGANELKDAFIWKVKCTVGQERQMAFCLMQKYVELDTLGAKVQIISVFAIEHVKGYIFFEADKLSDVIEACKGFCNVYSYRINLVAKSEIPNLLAVRNQSSEVSEGAWVRMKNGKYKGDLAKVVAVDDGRKQVTVKLVPRVDLQDIAKKFGGGVSLKLAAVPPARLISTHELETFRPHIEVKHDRKTGEVFEVLAGMMLKDGYLYKKVSIGSIIFFGVQPSSSELLMFSDATKRMDDDLNWISNIYGAQKENSSTKTSDEKKSIDMKNGYNLHDLVLFGRKNFGVIVSIEKDCLRILRGDIEGAEVVAVRTEDVKSSCVDKMFTALDWKGRRIVINDTVNVFLGPSEGRGGVVKHMYKGTLFIQVENGTESSEFYCAKSKSCEKTSVSKDSRGSNFLKDKGKGEPNSSFLKSTMQEDDRETNNASCSMRYSRSDTEQMFSIGQSLRIREGPLKGYLCRVVAIYRSDITVKLDSPVKLITVKDTSLAVPKAIRDNPSDRPDHFGIREMLSIGIGDAEDSWANKLPSGNTIDGWGKEPGSSDLEREADPWGNMVKMKTGGSGDVIDAWGQEIGANPCSSKETCAAEDVWDASSRCALEKAETSWKKSDDWSKGTLDTKTSERDGWEQSKLSVSEAGGEWDMGNGLQNNACPWDNNGKEKIHCREDTWRKAAGSQEKSKDGSDVAAEGWVRSDNNAGSWDNKGKGKLSLEEDAPDQDGIGSKNKSFDGWNKLAQEADSRTDAKSVDDVSNWEKEARTPKDSSSGWERFQTCKSSEWNNDGERGIESSGWQQSSFKDISREKTVEGGCDKPRVDEPRNILKAVADICSQDGAARSDDKGRCVSLNKSSNWTDSQINNAEAWDNKGKGTIADEDSWGKTNNSQVRKIDVADNWAGKSNQNEETPSLGGGNLNSSWDAAIKSDQVDEWGKANDSFAGKSDQWKGTSEMNTEPGAWNQTQFSNQSGSNNWIRPKSFGDEADNRDWSDDWNKSREGGRGFGRGRGRGRNNGDNRNNYSSNNNWNRPMDGDRSSSWGRGRGRNDETGGDRQSKWNSQSDPDGGRGSSWGRGRGRFRNRERNQDDNSYGQPNQDYGGRRGRGRGWGNNYGNKFDCTRNSNNSGSWGPGRGSFSLVDSKDNRDNWASEEKKGWGNNYGNKFDCTRNSNNSGSWGPGRGSFSLVDSKDNRDNWASEEKKGWPNWSKDEVGEASNNDQEEKNWGRTKDPGSSSHSVWDKRSTGTGDVSKAAETWSNTELTQEAGDQGCSWDKAAGSWNPNNEKSGSKGGW